jgi:hypothetical protein
LARFFRSFDDAWSYFVARAEPLEDFFADFPDDEDAVLEGWVVEPPRDVKLAAGRVQSQLSRFGWLVPVPHHFLHVWVGVRDRIGDSWRHWQEIEPFSVVYRRVNCFHSAVVVEVEGAMRGLVAGTPNDLPTFLPHMTVAVVAEPRAPAELRSTLVPLRDVQLGEQLVSEVKLVRFPAARSTLFDPWTVRQTVSLR